MEFDHLLAGPGQCLWLYTSCFPEPTFLQSPDSGGPKEHPILHSPEQPVSVRRRATTGVGQPTSCVRQGDGRGRGLSLMIFNLAVEPLIRRAKAQTNGGFKLYNTCLKVTAYADDIAVVCSSPTDLQYTINGLNRTASTLGLLFNVGKCSLLLSLRARPALQQGFPSTVCRFGHRRGRELPPPAKLSWRIHWHHAG